LRDLKIKTAASYFGCINAKNNKRPSFGMKRPSRIIVWQKIWWHRVLRLLIKYRGKNFITILQAIDSKMTQFGFVEI